MKKIIITKDGLYRVYGGIELEELIIKHTDKGNIYIKGRTFPKKESYNLCRCGKSKNNPYCDGSHVLENFDGTLTGALDPFKEDCTEYEGKILKLIDSEKLCAYARFCHNNKTDVWEATVNDDITTTEKMVNECPAGRFILIDKKTNEVIEKELEEKIYILQDPSENCSGPLYIQGGIQIGDEYGNVYKRRSKVTLCRCGKSNNKPYCDAKHVSTKFNDKKS